MCGEMETPTQILAATREAFQEQEAMYRRWHMKQERENWFYMDHKAEEEREWLQRWKLTGERIRAFVVDKQLEDNKEALKKMEERHPSHTYSYEQLPSEDKEYLTQIIQESADKLYKIETHRRHMWEKKQQETAEAINRRKRPALTEDEAIQMPKGKRQKELIHQMADFTFEVMQEIWEAQDQEEEEA